jgi:hypothetical protein
LIKTHYIKMNLGQRKIKQSDNIFLLEWRAANFHHDFIIYYREAHHNPQQKLMIFYHISRPPIVAQITKRKLTYFIHNRAFRVLYTVLLNEWFKEWLLMLIY